MLMKQNKNQQNMKFNSASAISFYFIHDFSSSYSLKSLDSINSYNNFD